jgi:hypothetical protein
VQALVAAVVAAVVAVPVGSLGESGGAVGADAPKSSLCSINRPVVQQPIRTTSACAARRTAAHCPAGTGAGVDVDAGEVVHTPYTDRGVLLSCVMRCYATPEPFCWAWFVIA